MAVGALGVVGRVRVAGWEYSNFNDGLQTVLNESSSGGSSAAPDLGSEWCAADPSAIPSSSTRDECALEIQQKLGGGTVYRATLKFGRMIYSYRGVQPGWYNYYFVVKGGQAFYAWTGRGGEPLAEYEAQFEDDGDQLANFESGTLTFDQEGNVYRFTAGQ